MVYLFSGAPRWQQGVLLAGLTAVVIVIGSTFRRRSLEHVAQTADDWCGAHQLFCSALELAGLTTEQRRGAGAYVLRQSEKTRARRRPRTPIQAHGILDEAVVHTRESGTDRGFFIYAAGGEARVRDRAGASAAGFFDGLHDRTLTRGLKR